MSGVQPFAPHEAPVDFALPAGFGGGAAVARTEEGAAFAELGAGGVASGVAAEAAGGVGVFSTGALCAGGRPTPSGAADARSALLQPIDVPAPSTASAVTNVSRLSEGLRISAW